MKVILGMGGTRDNTRPAQQSLKWQIAYNEVGGFGPATDSHKRGYVHLNTTQGGFRVYPLSKSDLQKLLNILRMGKNRQLASIWQNAGLVTPDESDAFERLEQLKKMLDVGLITDEMFQEKREEILEGL